jgi:lipoprotein NlpI
MIKLFAGITFLTCAATVSAQGPDTLLQEGDVAARAGKIDKALAHYEDAVKAIGRLIELKPYDAANYQQRGIVHFKLAKVDLSIRDFDRYIALRPEQKISHWQRGISYYYAGRYDDGKQQFEGYQDFDSNDVENAVWRFMCMAKKDGVAKARKSILKIGDDRRVPMRQVYDLFKGELKPDEVLAAARAGSPPQEQLNHQLFYAHLYVGIYHDLIGERKRALEQMNQAVAHPIGHYMWDVARIHREVLQKPATP